MCRSLKSNYVLEFFSCAFSLLLLAGCCCRGSPSVTTTIPSSRPSTESPQNKSAIDFYVRPSTSTYLLLAYQQDFLEHEGQHHRGKRFEQLVNVLVSLRNQGHPVNEVQLLMILGPPDYGGSIPIGASYVYLFAGQHGIECITIDIAKNGTMTDVGWNAASEMDMTGFNSYPKWNLK